MPPKIGFIGNFQHKPNLEGINWFISYVWEKIKNEITEVKLRLVGSGSANINKKQSDIEMLGYIDDPGDEIDSWSLMVVPILWGGGTRVKIAHAFSRKCPVVATRLGAYGYDVTDGREILLADTPEEFAAKCIRLLKNPQEGERLAEAAWEKFLKEYTWDSIYPKVEEAVYALLERNARSLKY